MSFDDFSSGQGPGLLDKLTEAVQGLGTRLLVHVCAIIVALFADMPGSGLLSQAALKFSLYIGLICLIPAGIGKKPDWLIPTGCGIFLLFFWSLWGVPWQFSLPWAGALTWTVRLLMKQGSINWEWAVLPWLVVSLYNSYGVPMLPGQSAPPVWTFPFLAAGGWLLMRFYSARLGDPVQLSTMREACARLEKKLHSRSLPLELEDPVRDLLAQGRRFLELCPRMGKDTAPLVSSFALTAGKLLRLLSSGVTSTDVQNQLRAISQTNGVLTDYMQALQDEEKRKQGRALPIDAALAARLEQFRTEAVRLKDKSRSLPDGIRAHVEGIARATERILFRMREDPQDVPPGDRFLSRYLPAAHTVVDEYTRLGSQASASQNIGGALERSKDLLQRLEEAFSHEHSRLLENDAINFTAELNVLDKLLKMDGR